MARHPFGPRAGRRNRNRTYTILVAVLVICVVIAFYYGPFGKNEADTIDTTPPGEMNTNAVSPDESIKPAEPQITREPEIIKEPEVSEEPLQNELTASVPPVEVPPEPELPKIIPEPVPGPIVEPNPEAAALIAEAAALISEPPVKIVEARDRLNRALRMPMSAQQRLSVKNQLSELSDKWLFSRTILPDDPLSESYLVRSGDRLSTIGSKFKVPHEILMTVNKISRPEALQAGIAIKVIKGPFHAKVYRSTFTMDVYLQNTYVRSYRVGLGKPGMETPTGQWRVKSDGKLVKPPWTNPVDNKTYHPEDPDYPLGSRWIGLEGLSGAAKDRTGFAIHGTKDPDQIGMAGSQGCIRMHNGNAILVYNMLYPGQSLV
ncbi:MAG: L,D-transpeptidase family protein, partial [Planctomycetota bacterium]